MRDQRPGSAQRPPERPWFDAAFERGYLELYPHRDLAAARAEVDGLLARGLAASGGRVLDLGCGFGRHLVALRARGLDALGLDRSRELLARVPAEARAHVVRGDFRALPFCAGGFAAVVNLFSSFGYFDEAGNARALAELARVLAPGGLAVLDLMNPARVRSTLVGESVTRRGGLELCERRTLSDGGRRVRKEVRVRSEEGSERRWIEDVRLFEPEELGPLLRGAGLELRRVEGDFDGRAFAPDAPRQIAWTAKDTR